MVYQPCSAQLAFLTKLELKLGLSEKAVSILYLLKNPLGVSFFSLKLMVYRLYLRAYGLSISLRSYPIPSESFSRIGSARQPFSKFRKISCDIYFIYTNFFSNKVAGLQFIDCNFVYIRMVMMIPRFLNDRFHLKMSASTPGYQHRYWHWHWHCKNLILALRYFF